MEFNIDDSNAHDGLSQSLMSGSENDGFMQHNDTEAQIVVNQVLKGETQPKLYRDAWAAVLFLANIITIGYLGIVWGIPSLHYDPQIDTNDNNNDQGTQTFSGILSLSVVSSLAALLIAGGASVFMAHNAKLLVQFSLMFSIVCDSIMVLYFILQKNASGIIVSLLILVIALWYTISVWRRIPFAAANLETALTAVRTNGGISLIAYATTIAVNLGFVALWLLAWLGVYVRYTAKTCQEQDDACFSHSNPLIVVLFLLSLYWTVEVGKNVLHVTVSGVVGTWWFAPDDASRFCSPAITDSFARATSYSAGSICLGSLLTSILQILHHLSREARQRGRGNQMLLCIVECLVGFFERMVAYFNKWAYVYIGLYGYDYLTAGKKVMDLFRSRGWTAIINDDLVLRVLLLMSIVIGILTGGVGLILLKLHPGWLDDVAGSAIIGFCLPFIIGTSISYILMGVVSSAVDTVIVAFCEAPVEFERNHPGLHLQMTSAWSQIYPEEFGS